MPVQQRILAIVIMFSAQVLFAQNDKPPAGGGGYNITHADEWSDAGHTFIISQLQASKLLLQKAGKWAQPLQQSVSFIHPTRAINLTDKGYYGISNYIDQNSAYPNQILDYNCGNRTYDQASGYNHRGTDIFSWPFPWTKMENNQVEVIAAATGVIILKSDGNSDKSCAFCSQCNWNAVYVRHADGTVAWYGHLKTGSLTNKLVGEVIQQGEFIGVMGSSGSSTGPHLHFEVWANDNYTQLIDPWAGPCNPAVTQSKWAEQEPYRVSQLIAVMTHNAAPNHGCYGQEVMNAANTFSNGARVYLGSYYRDQLSGQTAQHAVFRPDGTLYSQWTQNLTSTFNASWWYYYVDLPNPAATGIWKYVLTHNGKTSTTWFAVNAVIEYTFTGNGSYFNATNWSNNTMPANPVPAGIIVRITASGQNNCIVDAPVTFSSGATLRIASGAKITLPNNLIIQ